jgi:hypothetical protein
MTHRLPLLHILWFSCIAKLSDPKAVGHAPEFSDGETLQKLAQSALFSPTGSRIGPDPVGWIRIVLHRWIR